MPDEPVLPPDRRVERYRSRLSTARLPEDVFDWFIRAGTDPELWSLSLNEGVTSRQIDDLIGLKSELVVGGLLANDRLTSIHLERIVAEFPSMYATAAGHVHAPLAWKLSEPAWPMLAGPLLADFLREVGANRREIAELDLVVKEIGSQHGTATVAEAWAVAQSRASAR